MNLLQTWTYETTAAGVLTDLLPGAMVAELTAIEVIVGLKGTFAIQRLQSALASLVIEAGL